MLLFCTASLAVCRLLGFAYSVVAVMASKPVVLNSVAAIFKALTSFRIACIASFN